MNSGGPCSGFVKNPWKIFGQFLFGNPGASVITCFFGGAGLTHYCGVDVSLASLEVFITRIRDLHGNLPRRVAQDIFASRLIGRTDGMMRQKMNLRYFMYFFTIFKARFSDWID